MYMCIKFSTKYLNFNPYLPHLISTYTCKMIITPKILDDKILVNLFKEKTKTDIFIIKLWLYVVQKTREQNYFIE